CPAETNPLILPSIFTLAYPHNLLITLITKKIVDSELFDVPATDAFLAEIRAEARNEGINYTASRLAAAFNHGFINKSLREV
ncbi:hypothetical protein ACSLNT_30575, partial [Escherichia coli]